MKLKPRRVILMLVASTALPVCELCSQPPANCLPQQWDSVLQLTHSGCHSYMPEVVAVGETVHVIWFGFPRPPHDVSCLGIWYARSLDGGRTFSSPRQLVTYDSACGNQGRLAVSGEHLYILYFAQVDSPVYYNMGVLRSTDAGGKWLPRTLLHDNMPRSIAAHDSSAYVYFSNAYAPGHPYAGLMESHDFGETWDSIATALPPTLQSSIQRMAVSEKGVHVAYTWYVPLGSEEVMYIHSTDSGHTWSQPETLSTIDGWQSTLAGVAADDSGRVYVTWNDGKYGGNFSGTILLRRSTDNGVTWLPEQIISDRAVADFHDTAVRDSLVVSYVTSVIGYSPNLRKAAKICGLW